MINSSELESGKKYGQLTLTGKNYLDDKHRRYVEYICFCGNIGFRSFQNIKRKSNKSCGCLALKHGMAKRGVHSRIYSTWNNMINRCYRKSHLSYKNYGGRGIVICDEWKNDFSTFYKWAVENNWDRSLSLERKDNDKNYNPANCVWATVRVQNRNKRTNVFLEAFGERKCLFDWSEDDRSKVSYVSINRRINTLGWSVEKAITTSPFKLSNKLGL